MEEVCNLVEDVGSDSPHDVAAASDAYAAGGGRGPDGAGAARSSAAAGYLPGHSPVSIFLSKEGENNRPAGTTWVFADGSQVLSSSATTNNYNAASSVDDVIDEIDQFGIQTGGEYYNRGDDLQQQQQPSEIAATAEAETQSIIAQQQQQQQQEEEEEEEGDDLKAFMDEFELNTQGENFRRPYRQAE